MTEYEYAGVVHQVGKTQTFPSGFAKRDLVLVADPSARYPDYAAFTFCRFKTGEDRTKLLDRILPGDRVKVRFYVRARESTKNPGSWFSENTATAITAEARPSSDAAKQATLALSDATEEMPF